MQRIGSHISELLFDQDCVIVPSLGGFLASNENARMLPNRILYPPYRRIAFNVYLRQNDGLLANHLVETEGISYSAANTLLEEFTFECIQNLEQGRKVNIEEVGTLYFDHEKNIQFEAYRNINHRKDSFGMEPVHIIPVQRELQEEKRKPVQKVVKQIRPSESPKRPVLSKKGKRYIAVAAAVAAIVWFSASLYLIAPKKYEATSLNPFDSQVFVSEEPLKDTLPALSNDSENQVTDTQSSNSDSLLVADNVVVTPEPAVSVVTIPPAIEVPPAVTQQPPATEGTQHHIIAGVFKIRENALTMLARLQSGGFKNARIIEANGRNYVSYEAFGNVSEAVAMADSLRKNNMEGWIWQH